MSGLEHGEKRHEVAGDPKTDTSPQVNVTVNLSKKNETSQGTRKESHTENLNEDRTTREELPSMKTNEDTKNLTSQTTKPEFNKENVKDTTGKDWPSASITDDSSKNTMSQKSKFNQENVNKDTTGEHWPSTYSDDSSKNMSQKTKSNFNQENVNKDTTGNDWPSTSIRDDSSKNTMSLKSNFNQENVNKDTTGKDWPSTSIGDDSSKNISQKTKSNFNEENVNKDTTGNAWPSTNTNDDNLKNKTKKTMSDTYEKGKEKVSDVKSKIQQKMNMNSLLKHARYSLVDFINPKLNIEKQIPIELLRNAFGLLFLTEFKGGVGIGASVGLGIIIARKLNGEGWTGPCAIRMGGMSIGFQIGMEKTEHIFILNNKEVLTFINNKQLKLGGDASFSAGPLGRDANISLNVNDKGYAAIYSYSMSKGAYIGSSLEGQVMMICDDCNENYYGKKMSANDILFDNVDSLPNDTEYTSLINLVDGYVKKQSEMPQDFF